MHFNINHILINHGFKVQPLNDTIYLNLYEAIKNAILSQTLDSKIKLPPSRVLAKDLKISRSTVLKAYDLLVLEKYVTSVTGSGYFINSITDKKNHKNLHIPIERAKYPKLSKKGIAFQKNIHLINNTQSNSEIAFIEEGQYLLVASDVVLKTIDGPKEKGEMMKVHQSSTKKLV